MTQEAETSLTYRFAAIQIKMWHIQYRMKKIHEDQKLINEKAFSSNRDRIKGSMSSVYSVVDMLISFEHLENLMGNIFSTKEISKKLTPYDRKKIGKTKDITGRWNAVRNLLGGHLDLGIIIETCKKYNFRGTLLSDDLETDIAVYNCLILEGAINKAREKSDLFGRDLDFKSDLSGELKHVVEKLNNDWNQAFEYFEPIAKRIYSIGKKEKISVTRPEERTGLVTGN